MPTHDEAPTRCRSRSVARRLLVLIGISACAASFAQEAARGPGATYRAFVQALEKGSSLDEVGTYLSAFRRGQLKEMPADRAGLALGRLREEASQSPPGWDVVHQAVSGDRALLVVRGHRVDGRNSVGLGTEVTLQLEGDGWKIDRVEPWSEFEVLPAEPVSRPGPSASGPGAAPRPANAFDPAGYALATQAAGSGGAWDGSIVFDPRGRYVAVADGQNAWIRLWNLATGKEIWSAQAWHVPGTLSFRADGADFAIIGESGWTPRVIPLAPNLEQSPPEGRYFFSMPLLAEAAGAIDGQPIGNALAYHPTQAILALGLGDAQDDQKGAIVLQPAGDGLWRPGRPQAPTAWRTDGMPMALSWAPRGDRLAWLLANLEPGSPIYVRNLPADSPPRMLSRPGFVPIRMAFGPKGRLLAVGGPATDGLTVLVWDTETGKEIASIPGIARFAFAPDGVHLFAVRDRAGQNEPGAGDEILVWKLGAPQPAYAIPAFRSAQQQESRGVANLALSPNGRFLIAVSDAGDVQLWDAGGGI